MPPTGRRSPLGTASSATATPCSSSDRETIGYSPLISAPTSLSRRRLLAAAPAGALAPPLLAFPQPPATPPLPPPLPPDVFRERQERIVIKAKKRGFDALVVLPSTNLRYVANTDPGRSERLRTATGASLADATAVFDVLRMVKSAAAAPNGNEPLSVRTPELVVLTP